MRWIPSENGDTLCVAHQTTFRAPRTCADCAADPGDPIDEIVEIAIAFPADVSSDRTAWHDLSEDAVRIGGDLAYLRSVMRSLRAKVITEEVVDMICKTSLVAARVQDSRTKILRSIAELAAAHRRDERTRQMLGTKVLDRRRGN